mmetsp:Transcript_5936/g.12101  ORF Transcript_5936/g.12101 Transcript_5936/m.12101 type:complete len:145 (+) Transcript_5936:1253-1687(+)
MLIGRPLVTPLMDLAKFVLEHIVPRKIPPPPPTSIFSEPAPPPAVIMKLDIEGSEYTVLPHLALSGALCHIDTAFLEYHDQNDIKSPCSLHCKLQSLVEAEPTCHTRIIDGDDETYSSPRRNKPLLAKPDGKEGQVIPLGQPHY